MIALGNNVHLFARPSRRPELVWCFEAALGCGPVRTVEHPAMREPMRASQYRVRRGCPR
jgi:hypothetical protein